MNPQYKKQILIIVSAVFILTNGLIAYFVINKNVKPQSTESIKLGLFSKNEDQYLLNNIDRIHYFSVWGKEFDDRNNTILSRIEAIGKPGIVTLEPWPQFEENNDRKLLLTNIKDGKYNQIIKDFCSLADSKIKDKLYLRVGHEMELNNTSRYPWSFNEPELFIFAYRNYVDQCKSVTSKVIYVWSPAGNDKQELYYPGDNYVDIVGMSWYSYPAYEWFTYKKILPFDEIMKDKYNRVSRFNKPIMAAEFGFAGTPDQKLTIFNPLLNRGDLKKKYPLLESIVLFSDKTESWVPNIIEPPDWTITEEKLKQI